MVTKGIITSIDYNGNTCQVRIPFFETAGNDPISGTAIISNTPGSYNGYKVDDVVLVAFEDGQMNNPVIIGKLYLGAAKEKADPRGAINVENIISANSATLPADAVLTASVDNNVPNTTVPYASLSSIANGLNAATRDLGQLDRFVNNQFESIITEMGDDGKLWTAIKQNSTNIVLEANRAKDAEGELNNAILDVEADKISANVYHEWKEHEEDPDSKILGFGWNLTDKSWSVQSHDSSHTGAKTIDIFKVDNSGVTIAGDLKLVGYPSITVTKYANVPGDWYDEDSPRTGWITIDGTTSNAKSPDYSTLSIIANLRWTAEDAAAAPSYAPVVEGDLVWQDESPAFDDDYFTWKLTYCVTYQYNSATGELDEILANQSVACIYYKTEPSEPGKPPKRPPKKTEISLDNVYKIAKAAQDTAGDAYDLADEAHGLATDAATAAGEASTLANNSIIIAQGKSKNYYSEFDPTTADGGNNVVKSGDCWFNTGYYNKGASSNEKDYLGNYVKYGNTYYLIADHKDESATPPLWTYDDITVGETHIWVKNTLLEWTGNDSDSADPGHWEDIGGELVTNKLTANYINALDITTKKITVLQDASAAVGNQKILFKADGTNTTGEVLIGNFKVNPYSLTFGEDGSTRQFSLRNFTTQLQAYTHTQSVPNSDTTVVMKVTMTTDNAYFKFFVDSLCSYGLEANHYIIVSNLNTESIPTDGTSGEVYYTNDNNLYFTNYSDASYTSHETIYGTVDNAVPVVFKNVKANDYFYIVFKLNASADPGYEHTINSQAVALIPNNNTCTISNVSGKTNWTRDDTKDAPIENTTLGIGNKFNVTDDGTLMARTGLFGPWMLTSEKLAYNYHDYLYSSKYKPYLTEAGNSKKKYASAYRYNNAAYWNGDGLILSTKKILDKATTGWEDYFGPEEVTVGTEISAGGGVESTRIVRKLWSDRLKSGIPGFKGFPVICNINNPVTISSDSDTAVDGKKSVTTTVDAICTIKVDSTGTNWVKLPRSAYANIVPFFGFIAKTNLNEWTTISVSGVQIRTRDFDDHGQAIADTITEVEYKLAHQIVNGQETTGHGTLVLFGKAIGGVVGDN